MLVMAFRVLWSPLVGRQTQSPCINTVNVGYNFGFPQSKIQGNDYYAACRQALCVCSGQVALRSSFWNAHTSSKIPGRVGDIIHVLYINRTTNPKRGFCSHLEESTTEWPAGLFLLCRFLGFYHGDVCYFYLLKWWHNVYEKVAKKT